MSPRKLGTTHTAEDAGTGTAVKRLDPQASSAAASRRGAEAAKGKPGPPRLAAFDPVQIRLEGDEVRNLSVASKKEWLLANGIGGYAMSTVLGLNTRRQHGLLVAAMRGPGERAVVLSRMEETVVVPGAHRPLDTAFYPGVVHPRGYEHLERFTLYPFPTFVFAGKRWRLQKRVELIHGENTVVVRYRLLEGDPGEPEEIVAGAPEAAVGRGRRSRGPEAGRKRATTGRAARGDGRPAVGSKTPGAADPAGDPTAALTSIKLRVRPLFAFRPDHALARKNDRIHKTHGVRALGDHGTIVRVIPYPEWDPVYLVCHEATFTESPDWYKSVEYPQDRYQGLEFREDLWSYGYFELTLDMERTVDVVCTLQAPESRGTQWHEGRLVDRAIQVMARAPDETPLARRLTLAADSFLVGRDREVSSILAGFPWDPESVRDTMIALPGLTLVTQRFREAKAILRAYARALDRGLLPDRFPDGSSRNTYTTVDATLWFYVAIFKYLQYTGDFDFVRTELRIPLLETMRYFEEGTRHGIHVDTDGLLTCGDASTALTWMDARIDGTPVTPRAGKPVDVNALWYNALKLMERLAERFSIPSDMARFARRAEQVEERFLPAFWNEESGGLVDVVSASGKDARVRPNQLLAVSLPFPLLDSESAKRLVDGVADVLLTPLGVRSLAPGDPAYQGSYDGGPDERARALHQGTAWTWWLGHYVSAAFKAHGPKARVQALRIVKSVEKHLLQDGLGQLSEISWGDSPHWPRGRPAHAPAVAEVLRCYYEDILGRNPGMRAIAAPRRPGR